MAPVQHPLYGTVNRSQGHIAHVCVKYNFFFIKAMGFDRLCCTVLVPRLAAPRIVLPIPLPALAHAAVFTYRIRLCHVHFSFDCLQPHWQSPCQRREGGKHMASRPPTVHIFIRRSDCGHSHNRIGAKVAATALSLLSPLCDPCALGGRTAPISETSSRG